MLKSSPYFLLILLLAIHIFAVFDSALAEEKQTERWCSDPPELVYPSTGKPHFKKISYGTCQKLLKNKDFGQQQRIKFIRIDEVYRIAEPCKRQHALPGMKQFNYKTQSEPGIERLEIKSYYPDFIALTWGSYLAGNKKGQFHREMFSKREWAVPLRKILDDYIGDVDVINKFILGLKHGEKMYESSVSIYSKGTCEGGAYIIIDSWEQNPLYIAPIKDCIGGIDVINAFKKTYKDIHAGKYKKQ